MNVLLTFLPVISSKHTRGMDVLPPASIYLLAALLDKHGFNRKIVDPSCYFENKFMQTNKLPADFLDEIDVVAISSNTFNWGSSKIFIEEIHRMKPNLTIILGGIHPTFFDEYILKTTPATYIIRGEGEETLIDLLNALNNGTESISDIKGITYKDINGKIIRNLSSNMLEEEKYRLLPLPVFNEVPSGKYSAPPFESSRGCLYNCTFCGILHHKSWRAFTANESIMRLCETIKLSDKRFNYDYVFITDDCFSANHNRTVEFFNQVKISCPNTKFVLEGRITDLQSKEIIESIPVNQIHRFLVGIESGYNEGLKRLRKGLTTEKIEKILSKFKAFNSSHCLWCSFMIGLPWEGEEECIKTVRFAAKIVEEYSVQCSISWYSLIPSELWFKRSEYGINLNEEFFDLPNWFLPPRDPNGNKENFFKTHPKLTEESFNRVEELIFLYESMGIKLIDN
ncbi:B12-binding domain-containing radical SAM protein [Ruminiclostridium herbifermentans]|uniref:B12-binding domain-containing radical SAM protein n=1 Tax=Ruminiclostridium herbifermentans TaxID=2488810 RepID=A0A4U7JGG8_9FIRM|nr:radical SAM protein [Ruminiclostridium herbifermentans]QNU67067.1 B12-binding domain-containing radical SAM protein [Ruminiclostridium herbifermentans]